MGVISASISIGKDEAMTDKFDPLSDEALNLEADNGELDILLSEDNFAEYSDDAFDPNSDEFRLTMEINVCMGNLLLANAIMDIIKLKHEDQD